MNPVKLLLILFFPITLFSQEVENVEILNYNPDDNELSVLVDGKEYMYQMNSKTKIQGKLTKEQAKKFFKKGSFIDLQFKIENRQRIAKKISLNSEYKPGKVRLKGVLERYDGDEAYIDGRKIILNNTSELICSGQKKCGCTKGMEYLGFDEIAIGDFLDVRGAAVEEGEIYVNKVEVCENIFSQNDKAVLSLVESSLTTDNISNAFIPSDIEVEPNTLYKGEIKMGALTYKIHNDIRLQGYLNIVGKKILPDYVKTQEFKDRHGINFRFYVIDNPIPNAYAYPNGMVFIHTGLLKIIENEAQLAIVLGHEISHVTHEHAAQRHVTKKLLGSNLIKDAKDKAKELLNKGNNGTLDIVINTVGEAVLATKPEELSNLFHKDHESQADRVGLMYAYDAGYDIREGASFWRKMEEKMKDATYQSSIKQDVLDMFLDIKLSVANNPINDIAQEMTSEIVNHYLETIYTSHPQTKERIKAINDIINTVYDGYELELKVAKESYNKRTTSL